MTIPLESEPSEEMKHEAIALVRGGLGKAELEIAASYTAPFFWILRSSDGSERIKNGSVFLLSTGEGTFAVTAAHVVNECLQDSKLPTFVECMIGSSTGTPVPLYLGDRLIDAHPEIDIATFRLTTEEISRTGRLCSAVATALGLRRYLRSIEA
jgi:hypothetical protein